MFTQFEEGNLISETCDDMESGDKYNDNSIMPPLISEEEMDAMDSGYESEDEPMSTDTLEDIRDISQSHPIVNRRESRYKICDCIKQRKLEWKGGLKSTVNTGKGLQKVFKTVVKKKFRKIYQLWVNLAQKFPILFQSPETFLK